MDIASEKQQDRWPLSVRLTEEEWELLGHLQTVMGCPSRSQVVKQLIRTAHVRPASVKFVRSDDKVPA